jgi:hypothetical protein
MGHERVEFMGIKEAAIPICMRAAGIHPRIQMLELDAENSSLQRIEAAAGAGDVMELLSHGAMDTDHPQPLCYGRIMRGDSTVITRTR